MIVENGTLEMRERLQSSLYWRVHRTQRKLLVAAVVGFKEVSEFAWQIYGCCLYFSKDA